MQRVYDAFHFFGAVVFRIRAMPFASRRGGTVPSATAYDRLRVIELGSREALLRDFPEVGSTPGVAHDDDVAWLGCAREVFHRVKALPTATHQRVMDDLFLANHPQPRCHTCSGCGDVSPQVAWLFLLSFYIFRVLSHDGAVRLDKIEHGPSIAVYAGLLYW